VKQNTEQAITELVRPCRASGSHA